MRDYVALSHGWLPRREQVEARVLTLPAGRSDQSTVGPQGRVAKTCRSTLSLRVHWLHLKGLKVVDYVRSPALVLLLLRLVTGRMHQIRHLDVCLCFGAPEVCTWPTSVTPRWWMASTRHLA